MSSTRKSNQIEIINIISDKIKVILFLRRFKVFMSVYIYQI